jgi:hypothetical protein
MGGLNVHADDQNSASPSQKKKWNKSPKLIIGLAVLIAIPVLGTTFAATVNITPSTITFGQGQATALACDDEVTITPYANYYHGDWRLTKVEISGLDIRSAHCLGKNITLAAYGYGDGHNDTWALSPTSFTTTYDTTYHLSWASAGAGAWDYGANVVPSFDDPTSANVTIEYPGYPSSGGVPMGTFPVYGFTLQEN